METFLTYLNSFWEYIHELNSVTIPLRLFLALFLGGLIGLERERKHRPAGFRTYMLVCLGAALTMMISQFLIKEGFSSDASRIGAQVVSGVGFLGVGTIIVTKRQQVKGLTTAAGLWASACMGLAIGAGFYEAAFYSCVFILAACSILNRFNSFFMSRARTMTLYVEYVGSEELGVIIDAIRNLNAKITDVEITKTKTASEKIYGVILSVETPKKLIHTEIITTVASVDGVRSVEEL